MSFTKIRRIPTVAQTLTDMPVPRDCIAAKKVRDRQIVDALTGMSDRFAIIIGPCSAHDEDSVCEYIRRLATVNDRVKDRVVIIPRIYTNKPRTTGLGYKGMAHQPDPQKEPNIVEGLRAIRGMHIRALRET